MNLADELMRGPRIGIDKSEQDTAKRLAKEGKSHREIGRYLGVSPTTARRWIQDISQAKRAPRR